MDSSDHEDACAGAPSQACIAARTGEGTPAATRYAYMYGYPTPVHLLSVTYMYRTCTVTRRVDGGRMIHVYR